jgi:SAM-dependent methyltransferase
MGIERPEATDPPRGISLDELARGERRDARLLDIRPAADFAARHLPRAAGIAASEIVARSCELPPHNRALVVCAEDPREAARVAATLRARGWTRCAPLLDPVSAWSGPWETGPGRERLWEPAPALRRWADRIPRGTVLDLGCGSGRNAVYLALLGHRVTAVDRLPEALETAERLAARNGVALTTLRADLRGSDPPIRDADLPAGGLAAVVMVRFTAPGLHPWVARSVRPSGLVLLESFAAEEVDRGRMRRRSQTLDPGRARAAFAGWTRLEDYEGPDEDGHAIVRLVLLREDADDPHHD